MSTQTLELSSDSLSLIEPRTAEANICSLDDLFLLNSEDLGQYLAKQTAGILLRVETLRPYYIELWKRFDELKDGETICDCTTRKQYCKEILHRSMRSIQYVLYGRNETKQLPAAHEPIPSICPLCEEPQSSRGARGRHIREAHPDEADSILGKQVVPEQPKRINKHLVGAEVGDKVLYNSSRGTCSAVIVAINDKEVTIQTGKTDKSIKRLPLNIDCDTIRSSTKTQEKRRASAPSQEVNDESSLPSVEPRTPNPNYNRAGTRGFKDKPRLNTLIRRLDSINLHSGGDTTWAGLQQGSLIECDNEVTARMVIFGLEVAIKKLESYKKEWLESEHGVNYSVWRARLTDDVSGGVEEPTNNSSPAPEPEEAQ